MRPKIKIERFTMGLAAVFGGMAAFKHVLLGPSDAVLADVLVRGFLMVSALALASQATKYDA